LSERINNKDYAIICLCFLIGLPFLFTGIFLSTRSSRTFDPFWDCCWSLCFIVGVEDDHPDLDPMDAWDKNSFAVQDQVCEGLFGYNYSDPSMSVVPKLAKDYGIWESTNYTIELRDDVWFHDGVKYDATAAKWNFDRLQILMDQHLAKAGELFQYYDVMSASFKPIINRTEIIDNFKLKLVCNTQYGALESLLCFNGAYMLSPKSTPIDNVIDTATGDLVGTGPFFYAGYEPGREIKFCAWDYYWQVRAKIDGMIFAVIQDDQIRNNALLSGDIDFLLGPMPSMFSTFDADPDITLKNAGNSVEIGFLGMNNYWINSTFRRAISYALNYTFIIEEIKGGHARRLKSPIPTGIKFANDSLDVAIYNKTKARLVMQSMGYGTSFNISNDNEWRSAKFISYNYTYKIGYQVEEKICPLLIDNLGDIGIQVIDGGETWLCQVIDIRDLYPPHRNQSQLFWGIWNADYNDPNNYINPLFTNRSIASNRFVYNGFLAAKEAGRDEFNLWDNVQLLMEEAIFESNQTQRKIYYERIQQILTEDDMPIAFGINKYNYDTYKQEVAGFNSNPMDKFYFYPCYWNLTSQVKN
jgi:ABC-type transport system substrate-binding protein